MQTGGIAFDASVGVTESQSLCCGQEPHHLDQKLLYAWSFTCMEPA